MLQCILCLFLSLMDIDLQRIFNQNEKKNNEAKLNEVN